MIRHPYFNLRLHDDDELCAILGSPLTFRRTLHEWPLSCVQEIRLADGRRLVYKAQWGPSVEALFYRQARSPLLAPIQPIYHAGMHIAFVQPFIEAPTLSALRLPEREIQRVGQEVCGQISAVAGRRPVYLDLNSVEKWCAIVDRVLVSLNDLAVCGAFFLVTHGMIGEISRAFRSVKVLEAIARPAVLCHGDLAGDNLFVLPEGGYKVIDWQRPYLGPPGLDLVSLFESQGLNLLVEQDQSLVALHWLLRVAWLSACTTRWFTPGVKTYDRQIAYLAGQIAGLRLD